MRAAWYGPEGSGRSTRADAAILKAMQESRSTGGGAADPSAIGHHGHAIQFRDFVSAITNDRTPAIDGHEGRRSVEIVVAIYKAAKSGKTVKLPLK